MKCQHCGHDDAERRIVWQGGRGWITVWWCPDDRACFERAEKEVRRARNESAAASCDKHGRRQSDLGQSDCVHLSTRRLESQDDN